MAEGSDATDIPLEPDMEARQHPRPRPRPRPRLLQRRPVRYEDAIMAMDADEKAQAIVGALNAARGEGEIQFAAAENQRVGIYIIMSNPIEKALHTYAGYLAMISAAGRELPGIDQWPNLTTGVTAGAVFAGMAANNPIVNMVGGLIGGVAGAIVDTVVGVASALAEHPFVTFARVYADDVIVPAADI
jgi:hypothetical protein